MPRPNHPKVVSPEARQTWGDAVHRYAWHPLTFTLAIATVLWVDAAVSPFAAIRSLVVTICGVAILYAVLSLGMRNARLAALITLAVLILLLSKSVVLGMEDLLARMEPWEAGVWLALLAALAGLAGRILMRRRRRWTIAGVTYALNVVSLAMLAVAIGTGVASGRGEMAIRDLDQGLSLGEPSDTGPVETSTSAEVPDIYVLMLDGYPRADMLEEIFGYDNGAFLEGLAALGFEVAEDSQSEYLWTEHTLLSLLHRDYLERIEPLRPTLEGDAPTQPLTRDLINGNPTFAELRAAGYEIVSVPTPIEGSAIRRSDFLVDHGRLNEFEYKLLSSTFVGDIVNVVAPSFGAEQHRARIIDSLDALPRIAEDLDAPPRLVFAHLLSPHWPAVWTADGRELDPPLSPTFLNNLLTQQTVDRDEFIEEFRGHLEHTNGLVLEAIAGVIRADSESVIVVMSDHGTWVGFEGVGGEPQFDLRERTAILFAARTPGHPDMFPDSISPVNVFRYLLDAYLGTDHGTVDPLPEGRHLETGPDASRLPVPSTGAP